jgi:transposase-like protein
MSAYLESIRAYRIKVFNREMTTADAAAEMGCNPRTLRSAWKYHGLTAEFPMRGTGRGLEMVRQALSEGIPLNDRQLAQLVTARGHRISSGGARAHRLTLGIPRYDQRRGEAGRRWMVSRMLAAGIPRLREARLAVVARERSVADVARSLSVAVATVYVWWHKLGMMDDEASHSTMSRNHKHNAETRHEVGYYLQHHPEMSADAIRCAMRADGYSISWRSVRRHIQYYRERNLSDDYQTAMAAK